MIRILSIGLLTIHIDELHVAKSCFKLSFDEPAKQFEETFALGDGRTGVTELGGFHYDQIYLNDAIYYINCYSQS